MTNMDIKRETIIVINQADFENFKDTHEVNNSTYGFKKNDTVITDYTDVSESEIVDAQEELKEGEMVVIVMSEENSDRMINDLTQTDELIITRTSYDDIMTTAEVETVLNGNDRTFYVQLTGGEHLPQMGCWIMTDYVEGDIYFEDDLPDYEQYQSLIIKAGEQAYKDHTLELLGNDDDWKTLSSSLSSRISATSSSCLLIQKRIDQDSYRVIPEISGFTQPNDYSSLPEIFNESFDTLEDAQHFIDNQNQ